MVQDEFAQARHANVVELVREQLWDPAHCESHAMNVGTSEEIEDRDERPGSTVRRDGVEEVRDVEGEVTQGDVRHGLA